MAQHPDGYSLKLCLAFDEKMKDGKEIKPMKCILLLICLSFSLSAAGQSDPRVMGNRYEPVTSISIFKDIFVAAYDSGNREYIKSMVLRDAVPQKLKDANRYVGILSPYFNTRIKVVGISEETDGLAKFAKKIPTAFSHLPEGVESCAIIKYSYYLRSVEGKQFLTTSRFPIVKKGGELYIGQLKDYP
jgi:hypothetical protein